MGSNMSKVSEFTKDFGEYLVQLSTYLRTNLLAIFSRFEGGKDIVVGGLYRKRGKYVRPFLHSAMMAFLFFAIAFGPKVVAQAFPGKDRGAWDASTGGEILGESVVSLYESGIVTLESDKPRNQVVDYVVREGDTLSTIAEKFDVSSDTLKWANEGVNWQRIRPGDTVKVPPITGIVYKVRTGDTVYSIAKKFEANAQAIVDFPFNTFSDDENFSLVVGQTLIIPDGVMPDAVAAPRSIARVLTPDAGAVTASGNFVWPAYGRLTQGYSWYHKGIDIANQAGGPILAADAGRVIAAGWVSSGYGYHVVIDHGNGYQTLYAHLSQISVVVGQSVARGASIGEMGSTGRSTGKHLHFEIIQNGARVTPFDYLR